MGKSPKKLKKLDIIQSSNNFLPQKDMFCGNGVAKIVERCQAGEGVSRQSDVSLHFLRLIHAEKLPLTNNVLQAASALDPEARGHSLTLQFLKQLLKLVTNILSDVETHSLRID